MSLNKALLCILLSIYSFCSIAQTKKINKDSMRLVEESRRMKTEIDSLSKKIHLIEINDYKPVEIIKDVNSFYENAWTKLLYTISIMGVIIGIIFPYYLSRQQKRELEINKDSFKDYVDSKIKEQEASIKEFNKTQISEAKIEMFEKTNSRINENYAMTFYLQGLHFMDKKSYMPALRNFVWSLKRHTSLTSVTNTEKTLLLIIDNLKELNESKIKVDKKIIEDLKKTIDKLKSFPNFNKFSVHSKEIENLILSN